MTDIIYEELEKSIPLTGKPFGIRAGAYIVDSIIFFLSIYIISIGIGVILGVVMVIIGRPLRIDDSITCLNYIISILLQIAYFSLFEWRFGASPGKLVFGMRVIMIDGSPVTLEAALKRGAFRLFDGFLFAIPAYTSMKPPLQQRHGDKSAKTLVVDAKDPAIIEKQSPYQLAVAGAIYVVIATLGTTINLIASLR